MNTQSRKDEELTGGVTSWEACSELCRQRAACMHWTWHNEKAAAQWAHKCSTMSSYGYSNTNTKVISGDRNCGGGILYILMNKETQCYQNQVKDGKMGGIS